MARGEELAEQPTILGDALAGALAAILGADIEAIGPRWRRLAEDGLYPLDDACEVVTLLTVRADDDDQKLLARGYWYRRLPHDRQGLVLPRIECLAPPKPRLPDDQQARDELLVRHFGDPERLRRFVEAGWPEVATEIGWHGRSIRSVVGDLSRQLTSRDLWSPFADRLFAESLDGARRRHPTR